MLLQPRIPIRPPAAGMFLGAIEPSLSIDRALVLPVAALVLRRRVDHARDMTAGAENETDVAAEQRRRLVRALPRHDVVLFRGKHIGRRGDFR